MDLLKAELERKRKATNDLKADASAATKNGKKKYIRRGDLKRVQQQKDEEAKRQKEGLSQLDTTSPRAGTKSVYYVAAFQLKLIAVSS